MSHDQNSETALEILSETTRQCLSQWGITGLTQVQRKAVAAGIATGTSGVVASPTSSGKTLVAEMAILNAILSGKNVAYLVSHKALANQKFLDFQKRFSIQALTEHSIDIALCTGDRDEGGANARITIATYEKALGLILSGRLDASNALVVADEFQIIGDETRGGNVETLCALLRQNADSQFLALSATISNVNELADWMKIACVESSHRDVELFQEVRYAGKSYTQKYGYEDFTEAPAPLGASLNSVVAKAVSDGLSPVLVFTESRNQASQLAEQYGRTCAKTASGVAIGQQLELFTEPTESSRKLREQAERCVAFHSADLTFDERGVLEEAFQESSFSVCFATSTLAAGVNFPFRTIVFPHLTYKYGQRRGRPFLRSDYRNMSGRAGRLGLHDDGRVILLPKNHVEFETAKRLVAPENDQVESQLVTLSMRRTVLGLISAGVVHSEENLMTFFKNTFFWHRILDHNPTLLAVIEGKAKDATQWLLNNKFIEIQSDTYVNTPLGATTSITGLLPETAKQFVDLLEVHSAAIQAEFAAHEIGLIHWLCSCPEFTSSHASRYLPSTYSDPHPTSNACLANSNLLIPWDRHDGSTINSVHAAAMYIQGEKEGKITHITKISAGYVDRLTIDLAWITDGLSKISGVKELGYPQTLTNQIGTLGRRIKWGAPVEAIDLLRVAERGRVPGFRRQRAMQLVREGLADFTGILSRGVSGLASILGNRERAEKLVQVAEQTLDVATVDYSAVHEEVAAILGVSDLVRNCNSSMETDYEDAVEALLRSSNAWRLTKLDDGIKQNEPDFLFECEGFSAIIEVKTSPHKPVVSKEGAYAVLQKAGKYDQSIRRVTLGKPDFAEPAKASASATPHITLVTHDVFMEAVMRVLTSRLLPLDFMKWLCESGVSEIDRLPGIATYKKIEASEPSAEN